MAGKGTVSGWRSDQSPHAAGGHRRLWVVGEKLVVERHKAVGHLEGGWTSSATTPAAFNAIASGHTKTVTWNITPPEDMTAPTSANGVTVDASYNAPDAASGSVSAEQWVTVEKPLPLPPGSTDLALTATPSASYASPWTTDGDRDQQ